MRYIMSAFAVLLLALAVPLVACDRGDEGYETEQDRYNDNVECAQACIQLEECDLLAPDYIDSADCMADCLSDDPEFDRDCVFDSADCESKANCFFEDEED